MGAIRPAGLCRIPDHEFGERRSRAARAARDAGYDALLVAGRSGGTLDNMGNVHWLTRHYFAPPAVPPTTVWVAQGQDYVILDADGRAALICSDVNDSPVLDDVRTGFDVEQLLVDALRDFGLEQARVGLAGSQVMGASVGWRVSRELPGLSFEPCDLLMARLRLTLSEAECDMVRQSTRVGCEVLTAALSAAHVGATDGDLVAAGWQVAALAPRTQHWNFIASGRRSMDYSAGSLPSWDPATPYEAGDMIHPDCYGYVDGYMYDLQRTVVIGGTPTSRQAWLIDGCWDMAQTLGAELRDGMTCREIHAIGTRHFAEHADDRVSSPWSSWLGVFGHGFASGFDWPWLGASGPGTDEPLIAPYAVTIELWWGEEGVGSALIEDNILVLPDGPVNLTASVPKTPGGDSP
jgi:Xaa-Pro aminopeptidase